MIDQERIRAMRRVDVLWVALEELEGQLNGEALGVSTVSVYAADLRDALELLDAIAMEARQGGDGETRPHPKDDSAGPKGHRP